MSSLPPSGFALAAPGLVYREGRSSLASGLCLLATLSSLFGLWILIAATSWQGWRLALVWQTLAALVMGAHAALMLGIGLAPPQVLEFDTSLRKLRGRARGRFGLPRKLEVAFAALRTPTVQSFARESNGPLHQVRLEVEHQPPLLLGAFDDSSDAERWSECMGRLLVAPSERLC